jgi:hypothetical protein
MLKANEVLTVIAIIKKADLSELKGISEMCEDEFVLKYKQTADEILRKL